MKNKHVFALVLVLGLPLFINAQTAYTPPANCTAYNDGCNTCARQANGKFACTLKACQVYGTPRCTAYSTSTTPPPATTTSTTTVIKTTSTTTSVILPGSNPGTVSSVNTNTAVDSNDSSEAESLNIFERFWNWLKSLFS